MKNEAVFGSTLEELQSKDDQMVPKFVLKCIQCIENEDFLKIDGIYRVAGSLAEIQSIRGQSFTSLMADIFIRPPRAPWGPLDSALNPESGIRIRRHFCPFFKQT